MSEKTDRLEADLAADRARLNGTLRELEHRIAPGSLAKEAMHYFESGAVDFAQRLGRQVYANPLPSLLTGVGLAWLIASGASRNHRNDLTEEELHHRDLLNMLEEEEARTLRRDDEDLAEFEIRRTAAQARIVGVSREEGETHDSFRQRVAGAVEKARDSARAAGEKIAAAARGVGHGVGAAAGAVKNAADGAAHFAKGGASAVSHGASSAAHQVGAAAKVAGEKASAFYQGAKEVPGRVAHFNEEHPLASGAVGFALGAVIGSVTPLTRAEHDALKKLADAGLARGASVAENAARFVSDAARDVETRPLAS
jgi:hypothetical protein